jgi:hypothetical protein
MKSSSSNGGFGGSKVARLDPPARCDRSLLEFSSSELIVGLQQMVPRSMIDYQTPDDSIDLEAAIQAMNRNARRPKKANKGSRPCSRAGRRKRKEKIGKRGR